MTNRVRSARWWLSLVSVALLPGLVGAGAWHVAQAQDFDAIDEAIHAYEYGPITSLIVQQGEQILYEGYFRDAHRDELQQLHSVTKSIGATLIGMAVRRGLLDIGQTVEELLPDYSWDAPELSPNRHISLEHILKMRLGLEYDEFTYPYWDARNTFTQMVESDDWYYFTLSLPRVAPPDTLFTYNTGGSVLLSGILSRATGRTPAELFDEWIAKPLDIDEFSWELFSFEGLGHGRNDFPHGEEPLGMGLWLRPLDLLRIGRLYLANGVHEDKRLLDDEWIEASWTAYSHAGNDPFFASLSVPYGYGYQWWYREFLDGGGRRHHCWWALGFRGQNLIVCPERELVVVSTRDSRVFDYTGPGIGALLVQHVLPEIGYPVTSRLDGYYFEPATAGQGINIEVSDLLGLVYLVWNTYGPNGELIWYSALGEIEDEQVTFQDVYRTQGGRFLDPEPVGYESVGSATLYWESCNDARLHYDIELGEGEYRLQRLFPGCEPTFRRQIEFERFEPASGRRPMPFEVDQ